MDLNIEEISFLKQQGLSEGDVLDARSMSVAERKTKAKELGKKLIMKSPCGKGGHRLHTRHGHCVQCDTSKLAFVGRYSQKLYVYIAGSLEKSWIKVGTASDIEQRERSLQTSGYAGANDWEMLLYFKTENAGSVEHKIQSLLDKYASSQRYMKQGQEVEVLEVFQCSFNKAYEALNHTCGSLSITPEDPWMKHNLDQYKSFHNIEGTGFVRRGNTT